MKYRRNKSNENDRILLIQTIRSGCLHEWLHKMDRQINLIQGSSSSSNLTLTSEKQLSEAINVLQSIRMVINDFTN